MRSQEGNHEGHRNNPLAHQQLSTPAVLHGLIPFLLVALLLVSLPVQAQVTVKQDGERIFLENERLRVTVIPAAGGRIAELVNKQTGNNLVCLWKGAKEIGGALDDRLFFTSLPYQFAIMQPGGEVGVLRLEANHVSGMSLVKSLSLAKGEAVLRVSYEFRNGMQSTFSPWLRNFFIPGASPLSDQHHYFVPTRDKPIIAKPFLAEFHGNLSSPWAALLDTRSNEGILVVAPGVEKFYFWQGSREFPTFEWIYPEVKAGKMAILSFALCVTGEGSADWNKLAGEVLPSLRAPLISDLPNWVDEAAKFKITEAERQRGFWLSIGREKGKQRLPSVLELDLPLAEERALYISINVLKELTNAEVEAAVKGNLASWVHPAWEMSEENAIVVEPLQKTRSVTLTAGAEHRLWLHVNGRGRKPGSYEGTLSLNINDHKVTIPMRVRIWAVKVPSRRPFNVRGYGTIGDFTGGYETKPENLQRMDALYRAYAEIGGNVLDWTVIWYSLLAHVKIAETGEILTQVAASDPQKLTLDKLPALDFSYFDPWIEIAKKHGVTRVETYLDFLNSSAWQWRLLDPAVGKGRVRYGTPEAEKVIIWILSESKRYFLKHGFRGFFCKISDEISPEHIPAFIAAAKLARQAGWRPFTTVTGLIARTAALINEINPYLDQWQLAICLKDDFERLTHQGYRIEQKEVEVTGGWGRYDNGGARETWAFKFFEGIVPEKHDDVEDVTLLQDGAALQERGGSPWGNQERGVFFRLGPYLYFSPTDGRSPQEHQWRVRYGVRLPDPKGKPLAHIDQDDEIWFYGGGSRPFRIPYEVALVYPLLTAVEGYRGYGWWAFQWWQASEKIVWYDAATGSLQIGPTFLGLRDGWRDACLLDWVVRKLKAMPLDRAVSDKPEAVLQLGSTSREVYTWQTILNMDSPITANLLRRTLLEAAARTNNAKQGR